MATKLSQWERERFNYGEAAGDKKGDLLRIHAIKAEQANTLLFSWLSGSASEVRLPDALPISRGGTGSTTVAGTLKNLGYFEDTNHVLRRGVKVISLANTGVLDRFGNLGDITFTRTGTGVYTVKGVTSAVKLWGWVVPMTPVGLPRYIVELTNANGTLTVKVFTAVTTTPAPTKGAAVDLPANTYIDIELL